MEENKNPITKSQEIDVIKLIQKIWGERKLIYKVCGIAAIVAVIVAFSLPKEYTTKVILAPEVSNKSGLSGGMGALASMAGINLGSMAGEDAIYPELYPKIIQSTPFLIEMFKIQVSTKKGDLNTTLYEYIDEHQRKPWWSYIFKIPGDVMEWIGSFFNDSNSQGSIHTVDPFKLTMKQSNIADAIGDLIQASVDKKNDVITLNVTAQDPLVSATIADSVKNKLQECIIEYRTNKARKDLAFAERLYKEVKADYYKKQQAYAYYADGNVDIVLSRFRTEEERLKNEQTLAYNIYNQVAQQLQVAKAKVQEKTPVFTVIQPASVPLMPSAPGKFFILVSFVFLAAFGSIGWILLRDILKELKLK